jgi:hypothetical protein
MKLGELEIVNERIEQAIKNEMPSGEKEGYVYSDTARRFFPKIKSLRRRGFSFIQICRAYEKIGQLPKHSNPYSFRQAFLRELRRRDRNEELLRELRDGGCEVKKETPMSPLLVVADAVNNGAEKADIVSEQAEKERIRKLTGIEVDTGLGKIIKHSDGSFEY